MRMPSASKIRLVFFPMLAAVLAATAMTARAADVPLRVMLLSGLSNHNWKLTTPELCAILHESGRFQVDVVDDVSALKATDFAKYDVIVSNYNTFKNPVPVEKVWNAGVREAFLNHIREGHGFVVVHAGSCSFYEWAEYHKLAITTWTIGRTRHGKRHVAPVTFEDNNHPVTRGLAAFWTHDEFYENLVVQPGAQTLANVTPSKEHDGCGKPSPIVFASEYGRGRSFCLLLGHHVVAMRNPGFRTLLKRGAEWAATGKVTIAPDSNWPSTEEIAAAMAKSAEAQNPENASH